MDGRGRCHDNIFVERLWWTVKHEWVYLRPAANGIEQKPEAVQTTGTVAPHSFFKGPFAAARCFATNC